MGVAKNDSSPLNPNKKLKVVLHMCLLYSEFNWLLFKSSLKDAFLLPDDDPAVAKELNRRLSQRNKMDTKEDKKKKNTDVDSKDTSKWQTTHQSLAETRYSVSTYLLVSQQPKLCISTRRTITITITITQLNLTMK